MADVADTFEEQFFTCSICTDVFQEPKLLPCQHSFCRNCIQPYIKSAVTSENNKTGFLCPYCRYFVEAENQESPAETWVDKLPTNFNLVCMIEAFDSKSVVFARAGPKCSVHKKEEDFYCQDHNQTICANCAITVHRGCFVVSIDDVDSDVESLAIFVSRRLTKVNNLLGRINFNINSIKQNKTSLKRETKENFDRIKQELDRVCDTFFDSVDNKCNELTKTLQIKYDHCKQLQSQVQGLLEQLVKLKSKSLEEVIKGTMNVKEMINVFESEISKIGYSEIQIKIEWIEDVRNLVQNLGAFGAMTVNEINDENDYFETPEIEKSAIQTSDGNFSCHDLICSGNEKKNESLALLNINCDKLNIPSLIEGSSGEFSASVTDYDSLVDEPGSPRLNVEQLSDISAEYVSDTPPAKIPSALPPTISQHYSIFSANLENDPKDSLVTGVDFLPDDRIVVVDRNNKKLKLFSEDHIAQKSLALDSTPFDITVIGGEKIAVSFPEKGVIEFFDCELINKTGNIVTGQTCYGLTTGSGRLFVVCRSFPKRNCIKVYDGHFNLSQTIDIEHSSIGNRIVFSPLTCNLFYSVRNLLSPTEVVCLSDVCHSERKPSVSYIKKIPRLGKCVFARLPTGIVVGSQKSNLYWMSFDGKITEEILKLDLADEPCTIAMSNDGCRLFVTQNQNLFSTEDNNDIYMYDVVV